MSPSASAAAAATVPVKPLFSDGDRNMKGRNVLPLSDSVVYISPDSNIPPARVTNLGAAISTDLHAVNLTHVLTPRAVFSSSPDAVFVKPAFLAACENADKISDIDTSDYELRALEGLEIVPSQLPMGVKNELEALSKTYGAEFLRGPAKTCTHLIIPEPCGTKFDYADKVLSCKIVTPQWMHDSVKAGRCVDEAKYFPTADNTNTTPKKKKSTKKATKSSKDPKESSQSAKKQRKTPTRKPKRKHPMVDEIEVDGDEEEEERRDHRPSSASQPKKLAIFKPISIPPNSSDAATVDPDESCATLPPLMPVSMARPRSRDSSGSSRTRRPRSSLRESSLLLDSHVFYLSTCPPWNKKAHQPVQTKCFQLAAAGGASVLPRITPLVNTIVIVSVPVAGPELEKIRQAQTRGTKVVGAKWLQHCVERKVVVPSAKFPPPTWDASANGNDDNDSNFISASLVGTKQDASRMNSNSSFDILSTGFSFDENKAPNAPPSTYNFHGSRVSLGPLALRDPGGWRSVASAIHNGRGKVLKHDESGFVAAGVPTHVVCPVSLNEAETAVINAIKNQNAKVLLVTKAWVMACMEENVLLSARTCILYRPITRVNCPDFQGYTVALTGFQHPDDDRNRRRATLVELITLLGGTYKEKMWKKTNILVADDSIHESKKVKAARNWEVPVVGHQWLIACASQGMKVHHSQHPFVVRKAAEKKKTPKKKSSGNGNKKIGKPPVPPTGTQPPVGTSQAVTQNTAGETPDKASAITIFRKFASSLQETKDGTGSSGGDGINAEALREAGAVQNGINNEGMGRNGRSVSVSIDPHHDWSGSAEVVGSASQSQVIVHRDLTPPPSPVGTRRARRSMPPREAKPKRIKLGS